MIEVFLPLMTHCIALQFSYIIRRIWCWLQLKHLSIIFRLRTFRLHNLNYIYYGFDRCFSCNRLVTLRGLVIKLLLALTIACVCCLGQIILQQCVCCKGQTTLIVINRYFLHLVVILHFQQQIQDPGETFAISF